LGERLGCAVLGAGGPLEARDGLFQIL